LMWWRVAVSLVVGSINAGLIAALSFEALCPPKSKAFALVSVAAVMVGYVASFMRGPGSDEGAGRKGPDLKIVALLLLMLGSVVAFAGCQPTLAATYTTLAVKERMVGLAADELPGVSLRAQQACKDTKVYHTRAEAGACVEPIRKKVKVAGAAIKASHEKLVFARDLAGNISDLADAPKDFALWVKTALESYFDVEAILRTLGYTMPGVK
jgi:hypothetical protein